MNVSTKPNLDDIERCDNMCPVSRSTFQKFSRERSRREKSSGTNISDLKDAIQVELSNEIAKNRCF